MHVESKSQHPMADADAEAATGKQWEDWFRLLDGAGGTAPGRKAITERLTNDHGLEGWWAQTIAVEYERARSVHERMGVRRVMRSA